MRRSVARAFALEMIAIAALLALSCGRAASRPVLPPPQLPQVEGTLTASVSAPVTIVRDRQGVPHITASSVDDLFFAQGFVQAQDRLFQMDLWRRSVQGRLSEVLGANFLERDAMTRRIQYRGDVRTEWASYGSDTEQIARAFVRGINAWVAIARTQVPDEFRMAGWLPQEWQPEDLLTRTDAFLASVSGSEDEVLRARLVAAMGASRVDSLWPLPEQRRTFVDPNVDLSLIRPLVGDMLRRVGTPPFFLGLAAPPSTPMPAGAATNTSAPPPVRRERLRQPRDRAWTVGGDASIVAAALGSTFDAPSLRYLVHLTGPGWNVAGATAPWMPGVVVGHNDALAWGMVRLQADVQDLFVEQLNPDNPRQVKDGDRWVDMDVQPDTVPIKGRSEPFEFERQYTPHGVVIGVDRDQNLAYAVRWSGAEPGAAAELGALDIDRARSIDAFRSALSAWKLPVAEFVAVDRAGQTVRMGAGLVPVRRGGDGSLPSAGWTSRTTWTGWMTPQPSSRPEARADARRETIEVTKDRLGMIRSSTADVLVPLLAKLASNDSRVEDARRRLIAWDRRMVAASAEAALFARWQHEVARLAIERRAGAEFVSDLARRIDAAAIVSAPRVWFDAPGDRQRDALLIEALAAATNEAASGSPTWGDLHRVVFPHPLGVSPQTMALLNVGPLPLAGEPDLAQSTLDAQSGPVFRAVFDLGDWDRSIVTNAPGQSGVPGSPHYADLAKSWAVGEYFALPFSEAAVKAAAESTLTLVPAR